MTTAGQLEFPRGWRQGLLGEVCQVVSGSTPKTSVDSYWGGDIPWITPNDLSKNRDKIVFGGERFITQAGYDSCSTQLVPAGSVLFTSRAPIGYVAIAGVSMCTNQGFKSAIPGPEVDGEFLYWQLQERTDSIRARASGTTFLEISGKGFAATSLVVPPLKEQAEIVRILEEQFSRLDAAAAAIAAVRRKAEQFRRSILRTAFLGGLSLEGLQRESPWPLVELNQLNHPERPICYGILMPGPDVPDGIPYVKVRDMRNDVVSVDSLNRTSPEIESKYARARLKAGDVLVSIRGTYGRVAIVPQELDGGNITQDTARIAPIGCTNKYLAAYLRSPEAQAFLQRVARGVAVKGVNIGDLRRLPVPVPSTEIQESVVQSLDKYSSVLSVIDATIVTASQKLESTRRTLLHAAFTGELTRQWRETNNG